MAEKIIHPRSHESHEMHDHSDHHERIKKHHDSAAEKAAKVHAETDVDKLAEQAKLHAEKSDHNKHDKHLDKAPDAVPGSQHTLKSQAYQQTLGRIQSKLSKPDQIFSKFVHSKTVESISNISAKTVARPSGVLGGSICAFLGSLILLYAAKHYGFSYNYLMLVILFVGGYAIGGIIEIVIWAVFTRKKQY